MKLKLMTLLFATFLTQSTWAYINCAGETNAGKIVEVAIITDGVMAYPSSGSVKITEPNGKVSGYQLKREEIVQYFETVDNKKAIVGLAAYQDLNNPIWIKYVGENYDGDLLKALRDPQRKKQSGNEMRVWRGPGFAADQQSQFTDVVCNVILDV